MKGIVRVLHSSKFWDFFFLHDPSKLILTNFRYCRYNSLAEPLQNRRETLESWQLLFQFYRDMEDELVWVQDKLPSASAKDWGTSLQSTQSMVKKHQVRDRDGQCSSLQLKY